MSDIRYFNTTIIEQSSEASGTRLTVSSRPRSKLAWVSRKEAATSHTKVKSGVNGLP